ncbi:Fe-S oxidoreductase [Geobacter argillaceus]|uniref:Fe-S oxidoreductase n=1 Tax=Geobacter argillaceus TaxID=345631 RepID=A0A562V076_9BACT|nr:Fe-S oxidoreductase [Geobacter argillaceus]
MISGVESVLTSPERLALFLLLGVVALMAARTVYRRCALIGQGRSVSPVAEPAGERLKRFLLYVPGQLSNLRSVSLSDPAGIQHLVLFWGGIILSLYYLIFFFAGDGFGLQNLIRENLPARVFLAVTEILALLLLIALAWGVFRRTVLRPGRLGPDFEGGLFIGITLAASVLLFCLFSLEGLRFTFKTTSYAGPVSGLLAGWFTGIPGGPDSLGSLFHIAWWVQGVILACFMFYVPYSSHQHALFAPFNIFASSPQPTGRLSVIAMDDTYRGLSGVQDFTWKQLLEFYGCTQCGKCQDACPANAAGKPLSPKKVIQDLRIWVDETGNLVPFWKGGNKGGNGNCADAAGRVSDEELWSCTTCMACVQACPAFISSVDKIVDLRRDRVLSRSRFFPELTNLFRDLENLGDVFGRGRSRREDWAVGRSIKVLANDNQADTLFWVGCQASFHDRHQKSAISLARVLRKAGVDLAIMGKGELCCGDPMRRLGNEYQYQNFVRRNIEQLKKLRFKRIVTYCPHCYNTLKNEYPQFDGQFEVVHYTELLGDLISSGKLSPKRSEPVKVAYHDPCYLARGNGVVKGREILDSLPGTTTLAVERSGEQTFCCGGGGGAMWMRDTGGAKINEMRVKELTKDNPGIIATSCPYCVVMLEDGARSLGLENVKCKDLIELVSEMV